MSHSYYNGRGALVLSKITPVITALFGQFNLNEQPTGNPDQVWISIDAGKTSPTWSGLHTALSELAQEHLGNQAKRSVFSAIEDLARHFNVGNIQPLIETLAEVDPGWNPQPDLKMLFQIAKYLDDGHELSAVKWEGEWHSDAGPIGAFGGNVMLHGDQLSFEADTSTTLCLASRLGEMMKKGDQEDAAQFLAIHFESFLLGINNVKMRSNFRKHVASVLAKPILGRMWWIADSKEEADQIVADLSAKGAFDFELKTDDESPRISVLFTVIREHADSILGYEVAEEEFLIEE